MAHKLKLDTARELYQLLGDEDTKASLVSALQEKQPTIEECIAEVKEGKAIAPAPTPSRAPTITRESNVISTPLHTKGVPM